MNISDWIEHLNQVKMWGEIVLPFNQGIRTATSKPDYDLTNNAALFAQNDATEILQFVQVMPRDYVEGTNIKPVVLWQQASEDLPVWKINYKWFDRGDATPEAFTEVSAAGRKATYSTGNLAQTDTFAEISGAGISGVNSILLLQVFREDNVLTGDASFWSLVLNYQRYVTGSRYEYSG